MIIPLETFTNFMYEHFSNVKCSKNGTHFLARCPLCGDSKTSLSKRRFNGEYNNGEPIYHCFNCGATGNFIKLYSLIKCVSYDEAKKEFQKFDVENIKKIFKKRKASKQSVVVPTATYHDYILNDCISINDDVDGIILNQYKKKLEEFIKDRNIHDYPLFIAWKGRYKGRVIIPIYENGHIIFFQGRTLVNDPKKYDNPPAEKGFVVLNKDVFDSNKYIIITEGIFDALSIGNQGTTCLGASINDDFLKLIFNKTKKGIIIALDNDERGIEETKKIIEQSKYSKDLKYFLMPDVYRVYKDINMLDGVIENVYDFIVKNSYKKFDYTVSLSLRRK